MGLQTLELNKITLIKSDLVIIYLLILYHLFLSLLKLVVQGNSDLAESQIISKTLMSAES